MSDVAAEHRITVVLYHPDETRCALLARALERSDRVDLLATVSSTRTALKRIVELNPDVLAISADTDALVTIIGSMARDVPSVAVLVLGPDDGDFDALAAGAITTLASGSSAIVPAVVSAFRRESSIPGAWAERIVEALGEVDERVQGRVPLSDTETTVLQRLTEGATNHEIAREHEVTERLVALHVGYVVAKFQRAVEAEAALQMAESGT